MHHLGAVTLQFVNNIHACNQGGSLLFQRGNFLDLLIHLGDFLVEKVVAPVLVFDERTHVHMSIENYYTHENPCSHGDREQLPILLFALHFAPWQKIDAGRHSSKLRRASPQLIMSEGASLDRCCGLMWGARDILAKGLDPIDGTPIRAATSSSIPATCAQPPASNS